MMRTPARRTHIAPEAPRTAAPRRGQPHRTHIGPDAGWRPHPTGMRDRACAPTSPLSRHNVRLGGPPRPSHHDTAVLHAP